MDDHKKSVVAALIMAAGSGVRIGGHVPKQFIEINGKPILRYTLEIFQACKDIDQIYVVLPSDYVAEYSKIFRTEWNIEKFEHAVAGGAERYLSVWAGIEAVSQEADVIMIHDGVRPFVSFRMIKESIDAAVEYGASVVGLTPKDTVKEVDEKGVKKTLDRQQLVLAQTPQTFQRNVIVKANRFAREINSFSTDDAALVEQMGGTVAIVQGDWKNIKITSPEDLIIAKAFMGKEKR